MSEQMSQGNPQGAGPGNVFVAQRRFMVMGVGLCVMVAVWIGLNILISGAVAPYFPHGAPSWVLMLLSSGPLYLVAMPLASTVFARVPRLETRRFALGAREFLALLVACFPIMMVGNMIGTGLSSLISGGQSTNRVTELVLHSSPWVNALFVVVLAPILEEWVFRKQLIDRTRRYGERVSILLSAFAFALFHMNLYQFFYAFGLGLVFAYAYMRSGRLRYPIAMHMVINACGSVLAPAVLSLAGDSAGALVGGSMSDAELARMAATDPAFLLIGLYSLAMMALSIAGFVAIVRHARDLEFYTAPEELPVWTGARVALLNPGMVVYVLLTVVLSVWAG
ncbi:CPBP family intramembrane metalloprotease [Bifidobacterium sp. MA2]|uniref:CPBP family intramembrane metalloprotease n=1 Tax=Bifidobacterium santillanense TaxID=2809028 RepID=A0ABS5URN6_9BIFI|nr:type II CAAX endopeptidase family protein [Bifidobacterium santillanense]MBT1173480.1 CPBP family intramembrane metalloprotease [Bifidobacterium santillanense]